jgi:pimeloyl-ACP methyl ester carboxylesterase
VSEHAVIVPTPAGPIGGVVHEPGGHPRGALVFLHGAGLVGRSGVNGVWTQTARAICDLGVTVLRADYPGTRESFAARGSWDGDHLTTMEEVVEWFRRSAPEGDLLLAGECYGARLACELALRGADARALGLVIPEHPARGSSSSGIVRRGRRSTNVFPTVKPAEFFQRVAERTSVWALIGQGAANDVVALAEAPTRGDRFAVDVVASTDSPFELRYPSAQHLVVSRVREWASRALGPSVGVRNGDVR